MTEAASSTIAKRLMNCARIFPIIGGRSAVGSSLDPDAASRAAAVAAVRPARGAVQRFVDSLRR